MLIIVLFTKKISQALISIGLITNFLIISSQLALINDRLSTNEIKYNEDPLDNTVMPSILPYQVERFSRAPPSPGQDGTAYPRETRPLYYNSPETIRVLDGDEQFAYQGRARHDPYRQAAGIMKKKQIMDKYVREELDEEEQNNYWGRWDH